MLWLIIIILAYFCFAITTFGDKFLLTGGVPNPKVYTFYGGILNIFVLLLVPFGFFLPELHQIFLALFTGALSIIAVFILYTAVKEFEISRINPAVGGLIPIFSLLLIYVFSSGGAPLLFKEIFALLLLVLGSVLIILEKSKSIWGKPLFLSIGIAFYFALFFVLTKFVYNSLGFINGFIWIRAGGFLAALSFLFSKEVRFTIYNFNKPRLTKSRTAGLFIGNQIVGAGGGMLQNWAISLAPLIYVTIVTALQGVQYVFLLIFTILFSLKFPKILKEEISKKVIFQKIIAILLIGAGLATLTIK